MKFLKLLLISSFIVACGSDDSEPTLIETSFSDEAVTNFEQIAGVAHIPFSPLDMIIPSAYASAEYQIRCMTGAGTEFNITALGNILNVSTRCGRNIELKIRQELLASLDGEELIRVVSGADTGSDYRLNFTSGNGGFDFDRPYPVREFLAGGDGSSDDDWCWLDYTFDRSSGKVKMNILEGSSLEKNQDTNAKHGDECNVTDTGDAGTVDFRFKDGRIELDESGRAQFNPNGCAHWDYDVDPAVIVEYKVSDSGDCSEFGEDGDGYNLFDSTYEQWCIWTGLGDNCQTI